MAAHLTDLGLLSVNVSATSGEFWACGGKDRCGPIAIRTWSKPGGRGIDLHPAQPERDGYHLVVMYPRFTASEPVPVDRHSGP